ncbi:hypothetical protein PQX77_021461, partial [Marasmius sp. AFHP31]
MVTSPAKGVSGVCPPTRGRFWAVTSEDSRKPERSILQSILLALQSAIRQILSAPLRGVQLGLGMIHGRMGGFVGAGVGGGVRAGRWRWPRVIRWIERIRRRLWGFGIGYGYDIYGSVEEEQRYWASARRYRRRLGDSDARYQENYRKESASKGGGSGRLAQGRTREEVFDDFERRIPVISAYQPALPPMRSRQGPGVGRDDEREEYPLSNKAFCKWHRM